MPKDYEKLKADVRAIKDALVGLPEEFLRATIASLLMQIIGDRDEALHRVATMRSAVGMPKKPGRTYAVEETD